MRTVRASALAALEVRDEGDLIEAVRLAEAAVRGAPETPHLRATLARLLVEAGRIHDAEGVLAAVRGSEDPDLASARALVHAEAGRVDAALETLSTLVHRWPRRVDAWVLLARLREERDEHDLARLAHVEVVRQYPSKPFFRLGLGMAEEKCDRLADAEASYRSALALVGPGHRAYGYALFSLGVVLGDRGRDEEASATLRDALDHASYRDEVLHCLAVQRRADGPVEAVDLLREALALDPESPQTRAELGLQVWRCGNAREGEALLREACSRPSDSTLPELYLAFLLDGEGRTFEARRRFHAVADHHPETPSVLWAVAFFHERGREQEAARRFRRRALGAEAGRARDRFAGMRLLWDLGWRAEARELMERCLVEASPFAYSEWVRSRLGYGVR